MNSRKFAKLLAFVFALGASMFLASFCLAYDLKSVDFIQGKNSTTFRGKINGVANSDILKFIFLIRPSQSKVATVPINSSAKTSDGNFDIVLKKISLGARQDYVISGYSKDPKTIILNVERKNADIYQRCCQYDASGKRSAIIYYTGEKNPNAWPFMTKGSIGNGIFQTMAQAQDFVKKTLITKDSRQCFPVEPKSINFSFVIDISGSMKYPPEPSKIKQVIEIFKRIVREKFIKNDNANLSVVSAGKVILNLTGDKNELIAKIDQLSTQGDETKLFDAIAEGIIDAGKNTKQKRVAFVFSDGNENSSQRGLGDVINIAKKNYTPIYTISVGNNYPDYAVVDGKRIKVSANKKVMNDLALNTGGKYRHISQMSDILGFFDVLLDKEREEVKTCEEAMQCQNITVSVPCDAPPAPNKKVVFIFNRYFFPRLPDTSTPEQEAQSYYNYILSILGDPKVKEYVKDNDQFAAFAYEQAGQDKISDFSSMEAATSALRKNGAKYFKVNPDGLMASEYVCGVEHFVKSIEEAERLLDSSGNTGKKVIFIRTDCVPTQDLQTGFDYGALKKRLASKNIEIQIFDNSDTDIGPNDGDVQWYGFARVFPKMMRKISDSCSDVKFSIGLDKNSKVKADSLTPKGFINVGENTTIEMSGVVDKGQKFTASFDVEGKSAKPILDLVASYNTWQSADDNLRRFAPASYNVDRCAGHVPKISVKKTQTDGASCNEAQFNYEINCFDANNPSLNMDCQGIVFSDAIPKNFKVILDTATDSAGNQIKISSKQATDKDYQIISSNVFTVSGKFNLKLRYVVAMDPGIGRQTFEIGKKENIIKFDQNSFNFPAQNISFDCGDCWTAKARGQCLGSIEKASDVVLIVNRGSCILQDDGNLDEILYVQLLKNLFTSNFVEESLKGNGRIAIVFYSNKNSVVEPIIPFMDFATFKNLIQNLNPNNFHELYWADDSTRRNSPDFIYNGFDTASNYLNASGRAKADKIAIGVSCEVIQYNSNNPPLTIGTKIAQLRKNNIKAFLITPYDNETEDSLDSDFVWFNGKDAFGKIISFTGMDYCRESRFSYSLQNYLTLVAGSEKPRASQKDKDWIFGNNYIFLGDKLINGAKYYTSLNFVGDESTDYSQNPSLNFKSAQFGFKDALSGLNFRGIVPEVKVQKCSENVKFKTQRIVRPFCGGFETEIRYSCSGLHNNSITQFCPPTIIEETIPRELKVVTSSIVSAVEKVGGKFKVHTFRDKDILGIDSLGKPQLRANMKLLVDISGTLPVGQTYWLQYRVTSDYASKYTTTSLPSAKISPDFEPEISIYDPKTYDTIAPCKTCKAVTIKFQCNDDNNTKCFNSALHTKFVDGFFVDRSSFVLDGMAIPNMTIGQRIGDGGKIEAIIFMLNTLAKGEHTLKFRVGGDLVARQIFQIVTQFKHSNISINTSDIPMSNISVQDCVK